MYYLSVFINEFVIAKIITCKKSQNMVIRCFEMRFGFSEKSYTVETQLITNHKEEFFGAHVSFECYWFTL